MCESFNLQYGTSFCSDADEPLWSNDNFHLERSHVLPAMVRKMHLANALMKGDWDAIRKDLDRRPVEGVTGNQTDREITELLKKYGITADSLTLWGTGKPLREFLWSEEMADACVYIMEKVDFQDLRGASKEVRNCHINIGTGKEISIRDLAFLIKDLPGYAVSFSLMLQTGSHNA